MTTSSLLASRRSSRSSSPTPSRAAGAILVCLLGAPSSSRAAPLLRAADVNIAVTAATACEVKARFTVEGAGPDGIEHRIQAPEGVHVELLAAPGHAPSPDAVSRRGATLAYTATSVGGSHHTYELHYRVSHTEEWAYRCPIWLPAVPTDGRSRSVRLEVHLPSGARPLGAGHPALAWSGTRGVTTIGHLPSFVRVPHETADYAPHGAAWDLSRAMDLVALLVLATATGFWVWRRGRAPGHIGDRSARRPGSGGV